MMSINSTTMEDTAGKNDARSPATTYLIAQGGHYYPLYNNNDTTGNYQAQVQARPCCHGGLERAPQSAKYDEMDLYSLKPNVKVDFEETFQEPLGSESISVVFNYNKAIFNWTSRDFYIFLSALLGPILGIAWGLVFASMNFLLVWVVNPTLKVILQACRIVEVLSRGVVRSSLDPIFQSFGQMFTYLRGNFSLTVPGLDRLRMKCDQIRVATTSSDSNV
ncbi:caveolin-3-like [Lytechinus variegatus]|uniref:caveolin-3-like n=1 Tax=Lytechinus variegatus TaxID=7654 RepID=UPI001BB20383|nr:caveolin-3-like [Lytechinus variegatus]